MSQIDCLPLHRSIADASSSSIGSMAYVRPPPDVYMLSVEPLGYTEGPYILEAAIDSLHDLYTTHSIHGGFVWRPSAIRERLMSTLDGERQKKAIAWIGLDTKGICQTAFLRRITQRVPLEPQ